MAEGDPKDLDVRREESLGAVDSSADIQALEDVRVRTLGKSGWLTEKLKGLGKLADVERKEWGARFNRVREEFQAAFEAKKQQLEQAHVTAKLAKERIDVTLPGRGEARGGLHPVTKVRLRIETLFRQAGFDVATGPEIEDDFHNFEALNIPADHPARAMHDTFYFPDGKLLRTHTSPVQIRAMLSGKPPFALIAPGRVYRNDHDVTHSPMFHQVEGLVVGEGVSFANMKAMLHGFLEAFFERDLKMRLRPSYFPFTEPSAEVDMSLRAVRRRGMPRVQAHRLARDFRLRHGASQGARGRWRRCREIHGICIWHGHRSPRHASLRRERSAPVLRKRPALPRAIPGGLGRENSPFMAARLRRCAGRKELGRRLTMSGFELEALDKAAPKFSGVVVAEIVEATRHPQAEKLQVCKVRAGAPNQKDELLQIVCGAANARAGLKTALATVGAKLPGDKAITAAKLRGVESFGMLCSAKELGLADSSEGIVELPADAPVGTDLRAYLQLDDDILELNVTPNRGDAMSVLGIAREVAALTRRTVREVVPGRESRESGVASDPEIPDPVPL